MRFRFFNARPIILILISLVVGILLTNYFYTSKITFLVILLVFVALTIFYTIYCKQMSICLVMFITALIGSISLQVFVINFQKTDTIIVGDEVECVVVNKYKKYKNKFFVKDIKINGVKQKFNAFVSCNVNDDLWFDEGNTIKFTITKIYEYDLIKEGADIVSSDCLGDKTKYQFSTDNIDLISNKSTIRHSIKLKIKSLLLKGLNNENTELMYSALFGDKTELNSNLYSRYQISGVAHILAVSGLHVGSIVLILKKILQVLKVNKYAVLSIILAVLIGYSCLCNWSYSVIRASIMAVVVILAPLFFREYDFLSAIGFAGVLILMVSPYALFDISFVLSFMSVLGICLIFPMIRKLLRKHKMCNWFTESLGISIATNLAILVPSVYYFNSFNPISILSNIVVLPLFSIVFTFVFVLSIISIVLPFISILFCLVNPLINALNLITTIISSYGFSLVANKIKFLSIISYTVVLFFISKFNIKKGMTKAVSILVVLSIFALQLGIGLV